MHHRRKLSAAVAVLLTKLGPEFSGWALRLPAGGGLF